MVHFPTLTTGKSFEFLHFSAYLMRKLDFDGEGVQAQSAGHIRYHPQANARYRLFSIY
jgi:hypothetical protein